MIDAWKIGVNIAMTSNASQVLGVLGRDLLGMHKSVEALTGQLGLLKVAAVGAMTAMASGAALKGMWSLVDAAKELRHEQVMMRGAGLTGPETAKATADAWKMAGNIMGTNVTSNLKLLGDLRLLLGSMDAAELVAPAMAKLGVVLQTKTGKAGNEGAYEFARFLELRGALVDPATHEISPARLLQQQQLGSGIIAGTQGRVGPRDLLMFQQQARSAGSMLTDTGLLNVVPLIQAMGGSRTGTMLGSLQQQFTGGVMTQRALQALENLHLIDPAKASVRRGGAVVLNDGAIAGGDMLTTDPVGWVNKILRPALLARGADTDEKMTEMVMKLGLRQTVAGFINEILRNGPAFAKDVENIKRAANIDQYGNLFGRDATSARRDRDSYGADLVPGAPDPHAAMNTFTEAWKNLTTALGDPMVDTASKMLMSFAGVMNNFASFASAHPEMVKAIEVFVGAIMGVGVAVGLVAAIAALGAVAGSAPVLAVGAVIGGIATALVVFSDQIAEVYKKIVGVIGQVGQYVDGLGQNLFSAPEGAPHAQRQGTPLPPLFDRNQRIPSGAPPAPARERHSAIEPPMRVVVVNGRDLTSGVAMGMARAASGPPAGASWFDGRMMPAQYGAG